MTALFFVGRWLRRLAITAAIAAVTLLVARALQSRGLPDLKPWHRVVLRSELRARDLGPQATLADYLAREEALFGELRERVYDRLPAADRVDTSRYTSGGQLDPKTFTRDWNRTFQMVPVEALAGGVLLVHGLTDAPYSVRAIGEVFQRHGFYALGLRMPGHGTVPAALTDAVWEDWMAAVRLGVRAVRARIGPGRPLYVVGYSNGGALVLKYSLDALSDPSLPRADRMVLLSPMIGVSRLTVLARFISRLGFIPYFEKTRWIEVVPEYIPFKYNSFPANAAYQTYRLTSAIRREIGRAAAEGALHELPPILAFQSVEDATVSTPALVRGLFDRLEQNGSELVLFDLNRAEGIEPFLKSPPSPSLAELVAPGAHPFRFTVVTNTSVVSAQVRAVTRDAGGTESVVRALDLRWPPSVFSLSHVALPFPISDPLYGLTPDLRESFGVRLGLLVPRGERNVLLLAPEASTRLYSNPFFPYVEERLGEWIATPPARR